MKRKDGSYIRGEDMKEVANLVGESDAGEPCVNIFSVNTGEIGMWAGYGHDTYSGTVSREELEAFRDQLDMFLSTLGEQ